MKTTSSGSDLKRALGACRTAFVAVGLLSGASNILMLTGSFYMLQVYDRVLPSRSVPTLIGLSVLAAMLFAFMGLQDLIRSRLMARIAGSLDRSVSPRLYDTVLQMTVRGADANSGLQPIRDIDSTESPSTVSIPRTPEVARPIGRSWSSPALNRTACPLRETSRISSSGTCA